MYKVPVLFMVFNRPDLSRQVFERIREVKPQRLFFAADGPRPHVPSDVEACRMTRELIGNVDWDCEVKTLFHEKNVGVRYAVSGAISWFFENVEEGIILEDDTVPDTSFFTFCEELLNRYRPNDKIMHINGTNFLLGKDFTGADSYYFSNYGHPWGWATWKRAWKKYDLTLPGFNRTEAGSILRKISDNPETVNYWLGNVEAALSGKVNTWDYQWFYSIWKHNGCAITPGLNLVTNIGFGDHATNTTYTRTRIGNMKRSQLKTIQHPAELTINRAADDYAMKVRMKENSSTFMQRVKAKIKLIIKG